MPSLWENCGEQGIEWTNEIFLQSLQNIKMGPKAETFLLNLFSSRGRCTLANFKPFCREECEVDAVESHSKPLLLDERRLGCVFKLYWDSSTAQDEQKVYFATSKNVMDSTWNCERVSGAVPLAHKPVAGWNLGTKTGIDSRIRSTPCVHQGWGCAV